MPKQKPHSLSFAETGVSRRAFLAAGTVLPLAAAASNGKNLPVGLELYSVRDELAKDLPGTVRAVAKMGYQDVEFFAPYHDWTPEYAKETKKLLDELGIQCRSTHNNANAWTPEGIQKSIELNKIIGSKYVVMSSAGRVQGLDGWKKLGRSIDASCRTVPVRRIARWLP